MTVKEARDVLGDSVLELQDEQIEHGLEVIGDVQKESLRNAWDGYIQEEAMKLATLLYDIYKEKKVKEAFASSQVAE